VLPTATGNTALAGETIWRPTDARAARRHRIAEVSLSQRLVAGDQAHRLHRIPRDECLVHNTDEY